MDINISLKSNIYPAIKNDDKEKYEKFILYSDEYLTKIQSPIKMNQIREKHILRSLPRYWNQTQQDFFGSGENNPYSGIVIKDGEYIFIHNTDIPEMNFIKYNPSDYDYRYSLKNHKLNDLLIQNTGIYNYEDENKENVIVAFSYSDENKPEINIESILSVISEYEKKNNIFTDNHKDDIEEKELQQTDVVFSQSDLADKKNIFSRFIETEQKDIITADPDNVIFVNAGPGTGKTYVLIQRIQYLVEECAVPANEIQVLCFTNTAVNEIKERLHKVIKNGGDRSLANVDIRTFHSFAWWLIAQANERKWDNVNMHGLSYDLSIKIASKTLQNSIYYPEIFEYWSHFIVDEVQDLTNHLARFVLYIVNACLENRKTGITVLGDSCQAIFDYTLKDEKNYPMNSQDFYDTLTRKIEDVGLFISMSNNYRQTGNLSDFSLDYRNSILNQDIDEMQNEIISLFERLDKIEGGYLSIVDEKVINKVIGGDNNSKICFVCRSNAQTLTLSSVFRKKGIEHTLNVESTEKNYATWISELFYDYKKQDITHDEFIDKYNSLDTNKSPKDPEEIWERIIFQTKSDDHVYISDLLRSIASSKIDDAYFRYVNGNSILVSNIHRTKGREYDHVIVDQSFIKDLIDEKKEIEQYKTLYVALTRAKKSIYTAMLSKDGYYKKKIYGSPRERAHRMKRSGIDSNGNKKYVVDKFELKSDIDIDIESYVYNNRENIQTYIKNVNIGDPIRLKRKKENNKIVYNIVHIFEDRSTIIGKLHDTFKDDLLARMNLSEDDEDNYLRLPDSITDLYVSGKYTHIATEDYLKIHPEILHHSPNGVWQWVEFIGIGHASYDIY